MNLNEIFKEENLKKILENLSINLEIKEQENFEISASLFLKKSIWFQEAIKEYLNNNFVNLDKENSTYDLNEFNPIIKFKNIEKINDKKELAKKFHDDFFMKDVFPLFEILEKISDFKNEAIWDMIHFNMFISLNANKNDELFQYFKSKYPVFSKEIRKTVSADNAEDYIYVRNTCCGKYKTKINENCKVCPFINA